MAEYLRLTNELKIHVPALKRPTLEELQLKDSRIKSIFRDTSVERPVVLSLAMMLGPHAEDQRELGEHDERIFLTNDLLLGFQQREWLREHQAEFPEFMAFLKLKETFCIDFAGLVVNWHNGQRRSPYLAPVVDTWADYWIDHWEWLGRRFRSIRRMAVRGE